MGNNLQKMIYNLSAASPILFVFSLVWFLQKKSWLIPVVCIVVGIIIILVFIKSFSYGIKHLAPIKINTSDISPNDGWVVVYIIKYVVPFASMVIDDFNPIICGVLALVISVVAPHIISAIPNPLLVACKYHFYQVSAENGISGYVLISKKKYRNKQELKHVNRIFDFLLIDAERK